MIILLEQGYDLWATPVMILSRVSSETVVIEKYGKSRETCRKFELKGAYISENILGKIFELPITIINES